MDPFALWVKRAILHRLFVMHPEGIRPGVEVKEANDQIVAACKRCNWRATISKNAAGLNLEFVQSFVNSTEPAGVITNSFMEEFLVFIVMTS